MKLMSFYEQHPHAETPHVETSCPSIFSAFSRVEGQGKTAASLADRLHALRVQTKRLNALLELLYPFVDPALYRVAKKRLRRIRQQFSASRDAHVITTVLHAATKKLPAKKRKAAELWLATACPPAASSQNRPALHRANLELVAQSRDLSLLPLPDRKLEKLCEPGLRRLYRRAKTEIRRAKRTRKTRHFHEARRWIKQLKLALDACHSAGIDVPTKILDRFAELEQLLGAYRDRSLAITYRFEQKRVPPVLRRVLKEERAQLERAALRCASHLFNKKPSAFVPFVLKALGD